MEPKPEKPARDRSLPELPPAVTPLDIPLPDPLGGALPVFTTAAVFEKIEAKVDGDVTTLRHSAESSVLPVVAMSVTTAAYILFVIVVLPVLHLGKVGTVLWLLIGFVLLALVGLAVQLRARVTEIRLDATGMTIAQGTPIDREHVSIAWPEVDGIDLVPIDPADGTAGMQLRIMPRAGEPIDTLPGAEIGDLTETRRVMMEQWKTRAKRKTRKLKSRTAANAAVTPAAASGPLSATVPAPEHPRQP